MRKYIEHLKTKPEAHRKKVALFVSGGVTFAIAFVWFTSFNYVYQDTLHPELAKANTGSSPFKVIREGMANVYESVTGSKVEFTKDAGTSATATLEYVPE